MRVGDGTTIEKIKRNKKLKSNNRKQWTAAILAGVLALKIKIIPGWLVNWEGLVIHKRYTVQSAVYSRQSAVGSRSVYQSVRKSERPVIRKKVVDDSNILTLMGCFLKV